jgi:hypothetical protein
MGATGISGLFMTMYVYDTGGEPVGYLFEATIFTLEGAPLGRVLGSRVHRFDGSYVGEWAYQMVVHRDSARPRAIPPVATPAERGPAPTAFARRPVAEYRTYADAFQLLGPAGPSAAFREAAE